jgi:hypothetical protein
VAYVDGAGVNTEEKKTEREKDAKKEIITAS